MKIVGALCILLLPALSMTSMAAEQQTEDRCSPGLVKVTAAIATAVYDGPGGSKIGYLVPGGRYFLVETRGREIRDLWHLLVARGGAHIGWVRSLDGATSWEKCPHILPPINIPLELLYGTRNREQQGTRSHVPN
jgi:hypothetical protein